MRKLIKTVMALSISALVVGVMISAAPAIHRGHNAFKAPVAEQVEPEVCQRTRDEGIIGKVKVFFAFGICN